MKQVSPAQEGNPDNPERGGWPPTLPEGEDKKEAPAWSNRARFRLTYESGESQGAVKVLFTKRKTLLPSLTSEEGADWASLT